MSEVEGVRRRRLLASVAVLTTGGCLGTARRLTSGTFGGATAGGDGAADACPSFVADVDRTICAGEAPTDAPVEFRRSGRTLSTDAGTSSAADSGRTVETLTFTLVNQSEHTFSFNPYHWRLHRETLTGWRYVAPEAYNQPLVLLSPGGTHSWELALSSHPSPNDGATRIKRSLDPGRYAFSVVGSVGDFGFDTGSDSPDGGDGGASDEETRGEETDDSGRTTGSGTDDGGEETGIRIECVGRFSVSDG
ncbi:hypothetical protein M0R88_01330 [Halorussus gelatinilyticus]|uniref:Uncharacterized protein n=1 Tax=Halorussus gelatinilyticus TaxID=2937524 RepID=A0A8U0IL41_9EURY|nr:hypothetical protein [Halorussus gelatinilyticus]UPW00759.1 hypothetical protein M0R88_01330 [Halorussus gelatinilyticus]